VVGRSACHGRFGTLEAQASQLEFFDERIDDAHWVALTDVVIDASSISNRAT